mgnify:CR=1 FL=1
MTTPDRLPSPGRAPAQQDGRGAVQPDDEARVQPDDGAWAQRDDGVQVRQDDAARVEGDGGRSGDEGPPPFGGTWGWLYAVVLLNLALNILIFYVFTRTFS